ncbi:hypothetical protein PGT21_025766 [Puccinia graminis f. sp. tritici]|uniref:Uncharacterized protein n=1 Tax=Puccinia graminis f. sp. tritici TaxID=56615 RepID=A0A5B0NWT6_PUCGR|nr:hypothetical protein PGT21_025766 [Puccinia graminis f. sp. tritici]KAA1135005.1 hypothetical protein PGTUg99_006501 [Puccinia graminis f. sp. tritici]
MSFHTVGHAPAPFRLSKKASSKAPSSEVSTDRRSMIILGGPSRTVRTGFLLTRLASCLVSRVRLKNGTTASLLWKPDIVAGSTNIDLITPAPLGILSQRRVNLTHVRKARYYRQVGPTYAALTHPARVVRAWLAQPTSISPGKQVDGAGKFTAGKASAVCRRGPPPSQSSPSRPGFPPSNTLCACYQNRKEQALPSVCCPPSVPLALSMNLGPPYTPPHGAADNLAVTLPTPGNVLCGTINKGCNTLPFVLRLLLTRLQAVDYQNTIAIDWATPHKAHLSPGSFWRRRHGD